MKEYEFIIKAIEGYWSDQIAATICRESYEQKTKIGGFQEMFREYGKLHELFSSGQESDWQLYIDSMKGKREERLNAFIADLEIEEVGVDIGKIKSRYLEELEKEEDQTVEKRVYIYPYLVEHMRELNSKQRGEQNGTKI